MDSAIATSVQKLPGSFIFSTLSLRQKHMLEGPDQDGLTVALKFGIIALLLGALYIVACCPCKTLLECKHHRADWRAMLVAAQGLVLMEQFRDV